MKYIVWGVGIRGKAICDFWGEQKIQAYIDSDKKKQGTKVNGKPIISYEEYKSHYGEYFVVVSPQHAEEIVKMLEADKIYHYFILNEEVDEVRGVYGITESVVKIPFEYSAEKACIIWGINLYGIFLLEHFRKEGINEIYLVPHKGMSIGRKMEFRKIFADVYRENIEDISIEKANLFITVEPEVDIVDRDFEIHKAYDFSWLEDYHSPQIEKQKDKYRGKRCFIIGTGPSLRISDLDVLHNNREITFGVNKVFHAFEKTKWRPEFYIISDGHIMEQNLEVIENIDLKNMLLAINNVEIQNPNVQRYYLATNKKSICVSEDVSKVVYGGGTILFECIQFAIYMGFIEIYLLGVDFDYGVIGQQGNHFYIEEDKINGPFNKERCLEGYRAAKEYADTHGIKIYNATRGGKLEVFERVDFDELMRSGR